VAEGKTETVLAEIAAEVKVCTKCELARKPFVGASGKFLNDLLALAGLKREDVFITNVVKCRPPGNRDPMPDEMAACAPYLDRQIAAINPDVIVTLGRFSMSRWFPGERISRIHGQPKRVDGRLIVPMYHPAAALHQASFRGAIEEDFAKLPKILLEAERDRAKRSEETKPEEPAAQMKLF
jgi:DNA polymerase